MSGPHGRVFASHSITTKTLVVMIFSLIVVGSICTLLIFHRALAAPIVSDNFNDNSIDTSKWNPNDLFSGFTNTNVPISETSQRLEIGPLLQNVSGSSYRGMRTVNSYTLTTLTAMLSWFKLPLQTLTPMKFNRRHFRHRLLSPGRNGRQPQGREECWRHQDDTFFDYL